MAQCASARAQSLSSEHEEEEEAEEASQSRPTQVGGVQLTSLTSSWPSLLMFGSELDPGLWGGWHAVQAVKRAGQDCASGCVVRTGG
eukprot:2502350-Rhodomonas_salina.7